LHGIILLAISFSETILYADMLIMASTPEVSRKSRVDFGKTTSPLEAILEQYCEFGVFLH